MILTMLAEEMIKDRLREAERRRLAATVKPRPRGKLWSVFAKATPESGRPGTFEPNLVGDDLGLRIERHVPAS